MRKLSNVILFFLIMFGCREHKSLESKPFESHVNKYLDMYIDNVNIKDIYNTYIIVLCEKLDNDDFFLYISNNKKQNLYLSLPEINDSIYLEHYKGFGVIIIDNNYNVLRDSINAFVPPIQSNEIVPISYDAASWEFKVSEGKLVDFAYQFCELSNDVIDSLYSIPISQKWN